MSEAKHTTGPWHARPDDQGIHSGPICNVWAGEPGSGGGAVVACIPLHTKIWNKGVDLPYEANSRLIAAAPILQDLYNSEINFEISTQWDGGFDAKLGDPLNGFKAEGQYRTYVEAVEQLRDWAIDHFPDSEFAGKYCPGGRT